MVTASMGLPAAERQKGYERALREADLPIDPSLIEASNDLREHGYTEHAGYEAAQKLLKRSTRPTAIFATSDVQTLGVMRAVKEAGLRIPEDVALVGFDDIRISEHVGLTTIRQPMRQMGELAVEKFLARMEQPEQPVSHTVFAPQLIVRATTGCPVSQKGSGSLPEAKVI
jgi:LacI family transcriptional regulator